MDDKPACKELARYVKGVGWVRPPKTPKPQPPKPHTDKKP